MNVSGLAAAVMLPATLLLAPGAGADPNAAEQPGAPLVDVAPALGAVPLPDAPHRAPEAPPAPGPAPDAVPAPQAPPAPEAPPAPQAEPLADAAAPIIVPAAHAGVAPRLLGPGVCPEQGLQINTILAERAVSAAFPQIRTMIGVRPDAKPWHPSGRAIDIMIPDSGSPEGIALGDAILDFAMKNADRFKVQDVIWRGTYYTPSAGPSGSGYGHYDHVHITTFGGGYPTGDEEYPAG